MWHLTACETSVSLLWLNCFWSTSKTSDELKFYMLSGATFYDCINTKYQFIKPFLDNNMPIFEECGAFKQTCFLAKQTAYLYVCFFIYYVCVF